MFIDETRLKCIIRDVFKESMKSGFELGGDEWRKSMRMQSDLLEAQHVIDQERKAFKNIFDMNKRLLEERDSAQKQADTLRKERDELRAVIAAAARTDRSATRDDSRGEIVMIQTGTRNEHIDCLTANETLGIIFELLSKPTKYRNYIMCYDFGMYYNYESIPDLVRHLKKTMSKDDLRMLGTSLQQIVKCHEEWVANKGEY